jgi:His/Glu/Gln/Arg/opine family amino acid ABC transporter permease subunit
MARANPAGYQKIYEEGASRRTPPMRTSGMVAWMRDNLFKTWTDTILTLVGAFIIFQLVYGTLSWVIEQANWFAITRNLGLFMMGALLADDGAVVRLNIMVILLAIGIGFSIAAWARVSRRGWFIVAVIAALWLIIPVVITSTTTLPPSVVSTGDVSIQAGSLTERPIGEIAFIAKAGESVSIRVADYAVNDNALADISAFTDRATDATIAAARQHKTDLARMATVEALLEDTSLLATQRAPLESELATLQQRTSQSVVERFSINQAPVAVSVINDADDSVLASGMLSLGDAPLTLTLPTDGWYRLEKTIQGEGLVLLETRGLFPLIERQINRPMIGVDGNVIVAANGNPRLQTVTQYVRLIDDLIVEDAAPQIDDIDVSRMMVVDYRYAGIRPFTDYLSLHLGPFLSRSGALLVPLLALVALGYAIGQAVDRFIPATPPNAKWSRRSATWMWMIMPIIIFVLVASTDVTRWGGLFLTFMLTAVGIVASFPIGVMLALGRRADHLPIIKYFCITFIEVVRGVPLITVLFLASLALPLVSPSLRTVPGAVRAMVAITLFSAAYLAENVRGGLQSIPPGQMEAAKAVGMNPAQVTLFITLPQALRAVIPALVGQCISLFKDTSLVAIINLLDITRTADSIVAQPEYIGLRRETYIFISIIYFVISYAMAFISRRIEKSGSGAAGKIQL